MDEIALLREEIKKLREEVEDLKALFKEAEIDERSALLQRVAGIERRHGLRPHTERGRSPSAKPKTLPIQLSEV